MSIFFNTVINFIQMRKSPEWVGPWFVNREAEHNSQPCLPKFVVLLAIFQTKPEGKTSVWLTSSFVRHCTKENYKNICATTSTFCASSSRWAAGGTFFVTQILMYSSRRSSRRRHVCLFRELMLWTLSLSHQSTQNLCRFLLLPMAYCFFLLRKLY